MTLRHFQIFLQVCDAEGMTRAAEKMHISQPSVSQAIREMEEHYQARLFERLGKHLFLTAAGQELMHYARHVVSLTNQAESALHGFSATSPLRVGATLSVGESVFIPLLCRFKNKLPKQAIFSRIHNTAALEQSLLQDDLDIALVEGTIESEHLHEIPFMEDDQTPQYFPLFLKLSQLSIEKISVMLGYSNSSNFYKAFRDYYGHTPRSK